MQHKGLDIGNRDLRRLWLSANLLAQPPAANNDVMDIIRRIGFLQIDTIRNITRAHHHIIWSRMRGYRESMLWPLLQKRELFEHFTHDASLIPMDVYPMWQRQFMRLGQRAKRGSWYQSGMAQQDIASIRRRIERDGALSTHSFDTKIKEKKMWARPAHKKALEQMWYAGELATSHREKFIKFYDLGTQVFPKLQGDHLSDEQQVDYLCNQAMKRLGIANRGEIQRFWGAMTSAETERWLTQCNKLVPIRIEDAQGHWHDSWAVSGIEQRLKQLPTLSKHIRIINPFDPAIRDRTRLERLFNFEYRNEMFVPPAKRRWGYYVYPLLEGERFIGRIELKGNRSEGWMRIVNFWPEAGIKFSKARFDKLRSELKRFAKLAGLSVIKSDVPEIET